MRPDPAERQLPFPFLVLWTGQAFSLLGSALVQFALVWWLTAATGSATVLSLATLAALLPQILLGPLAGALVDRWNRRLVMIFADGLTALSTLLLAYLFHRGSAGVPAVCALLAFRSLCAAFQWPAMQASTTLMVPRAHLARVGGLNQLVGGVAAIFVPPLGALAMASLPMPTILLIDVLTAVPAVGPLPFLRVPQPVRASGAAKATVGADLREGLLFILRWRPLVILCGIGVGIYMLGRAAGSLAPLMVVDRFGGGAPQLAAWQAAAGIGAVAGGLILSVWGGFRRRVFTQMTALALDGGMLIVLALLPSGSFGFALAAIFAVGLLESIVLGTSGALAQALVPPEMQGRVLSLIASITQGLAPFGLLVAGPVADAYGVHVWWLAGGIVIAAMGIVALFIPSVMRVEDSKPPGYVPSENP
jgi:DHA3 family macrolide efflux protein-like MFS transporter